MTDEPIEFTVARQQADYVEALRANALRNWWSLILTPLAILVLLFAPLWGAGSPLSPADFLIPLAIAAVMTIVYVGAFLLFIQFAARRSWSQPGGTDPLTYRLTREKLGVSNALGFSEESWSVWRLWFETPRQIVLRHRIGILQIFPKRNLPEATLGRIRSLLAEVLPTKGRRP